MKIHYPSAEQALGMVQRQEIRVERTTRQLQEDHAILTALREVLRDAQERERLGLPVDVYVSDHPPSNDEDLVELRMNPDPRSTVVDCACPTCDREIRYDLEGALCSRCETQECRP